MSKFGSFAAGLGMSIASSYAQDAANAASAKRLKSALGNLPPTAATATEAGKTTLGGLIGSLKSALTTESPAATTAAPASDTVSPATSVDTAAFNDDATEPNAPTPFNNSYQGSRA